MTSVTTYTPKPEPAALVIPWGVQHDADGQRVAVGIATESEGVVRIGRVIFDYAQFAVFAQAIATVASEIPTEETTTQ